MKIEIIENITRLNDEIAALNRARLRAHNILTLDILGAPGCGKTALIEATIPHLKDLRTAVIVGDLATQRDAERIARTTPHVVQINTGKTCHLEAHHIRRALDKLPLESIDLLFIENVGNLICPVGFDLGQDLKIGLFAVSDGDDKPAKHPYIVTESNLLILTKTDLLPHIPFNINLFRTDIQRLNPTVPLLELSPTTTRHGMAPWLQYLHTQLAHARGKSRMPKPESQNNAQ